MPLEHFDHHQARAGRIDHTLLDIAWRPEVDFVSGLTAFYSKGEAHHRRLADAAYRAWQEYLSLAERYRLLAEEAAKAERLVA